MFNIKEGLAKRIISVLNTAGKPLEPITKDEIDNNHKRYGQMIDDIHQQELAFRKKTNKKPIGGKPIGFKQFRNN